MNNKFNIDLDQYETLTNVYLRTPYGKTTVIADQVLVKLGYNSAGILKMDDILIFENKLRQTTNLSTNQRIAKNATELEIRSKTGKLNLRPDELSDYAMNVLGVTDINLVNPLFYTEKILDNPKWFKVYDGDKGEVVTGIDLIPVTP